MKKKELEKIFPDLTEEQFKELSRLENLAYEKGKSETETILRKEELENMISGAIKAAGAKNETAVKALLDFDKINSDKDGLKALNAQLDELKKSCDYLFETNSEKPKFTAQNQGGTGLTKKDFDNMSYQKRLKLFSENPELYKKFVSR